MTEAINLAPAVELLPVDTAAVLAVVAAIAVALVAGFVVSVLWMRNA
ncbi:MAG: hypothetical protein ACREUH_06490 [Burkholderiales bacterium]